MYGAVEVLWKSCMSCSSAEMDLCLPFRANCYYSQHPVLLCMFAGYLRLSLHCKLPEVLEYDAILLQDSAAPHHYHDVQNLAQ